MQEQQSPVETISDAEASSSDGVFVQMPSAKKFNQDDPDTRAALLELVAREQQFFNRHRIQKRRVGSYWVCLAVQPTQEELTHGCSHWSSGYIHNRGELVKYFEQNLEKYNKKGLLLCLNSVTGINVDESNEAKIARLMSPPTDLIYGHLSKFRIKDYGTHKELHANFKVAPMYAKLDATKMPQVCPSTMLLRTEPHRYFASQVRHLNLFYFDKEYSPEQIVDMYSGQWTPAVERLLAK